MSLAPRYLKATIQLSASQAGSGPQSDSAGNGSFLTDVSLKYLEYLDLSHFSHLSITLNGLSIEEETIENVLGVVRIIISARVGEGWGGNTVTFEVHLITIYLII